MEKDFHLQSNLVECENLALKSECAACLVSARRLEHSVSCHDVAGRRCEGKHSSHYACFCPARQLKSDPNYGPPKSTVQKAKAGHTALEKPTAKQAAKKQNPQFVLARTSALDLLEAELVPKLRNLGIKFVQIAMGWSSKCSSKQHKHQCTRDITIITALYFSHNCIGYLRFHIIRVCEYKNYRRIL